MSTNLKDTAVAFLRAAGSGKVREAFRDYVAPGFRHHNAWFPAEVESLIRGMEENAAKFPGKVFEVKRALEDGDLVAVHSHVRMKPGDAGIAVVHIFRFESGRIAEMWDVGQPVPADSPNQNGMF